MKKRLFKKGDRVRAKSRTMFGWKGTGTVIRDQISDDVGVTIWKDDFSPFLDFGGEAEFMSDQLVRIRK